LSKHQEESKVSLNILDSKKIKRYHKSLSNLTPADIYFVSGESILEERKRIKNKQSKAEGYNTSLKPFKL
jgi:hypothetical protein